MKFCIYILKIYTLDLTSLFYVECGTTTEVAEAMVRTVGSAVISMFVDVIVSVGVAVDPEPDAALVGVDLDLLVISSDDGEGCGAAGHHYDGRGDDCDDHCLLLQGFTYIGLIIQSLYNETLKCKRISFQ